MQKRVQRLAAIALAGCTVCGMAAGAFAATPAATIGSTAYPTLNAAMAAAKDGETIVLQSDIDNAKETYYVGVGKGAAYFVSGSTAKAFTIDLNRHTITAGTESQTGLLIAADSKAGICSVTLKNGTIASSEGSGMLIRDDNPATPTTVTLDNVKVKSAEEVGIQCLSSCLEIDSATVTGQGDAIYAEDSSIRIRAGSFTADGNGAGNGAIASYIRMDEDNLKLDLSTVSDSEAMCIRPADWKQHMTEKIEMYFFEDVPETAYYYDPVLWAVQKGVTAGMSTTQFAPNQSCTRAQMATFLWNAAGQPKPSATKNPFTDVKEGSWYYDAVLWAYENHITAGTSDTKFTPNQVCNRAQVATFLWNAAGQPKPSTTKNPFKDVKEGSWYYDAVLWFVENNISTGTGKNTFSPMNACKRCEIVTFLYRVDQL